ncbi:hypothetical protein J2Y41_001283 [Arthrobacter sp. 1088]|nr:hypothetical protein [Arthrobacter sp. 1088]
MDEEFAVFCGLDVGKSEHHATALDRSGERIFDKPLPQDETRLRELFTRMQQHGRVLVIVDHQDRRNRTPEHRRRKHLRLRRPPCRLRRHRTRHTAFRHLDPRGIPCPSRQQTAQERALQIRLDRQLPPPGVQGLLRKKRAQGKKHNAAVICLARRRCDVIFSMLKHGTLYEEKPPRPLDEKQRDTPHQFLPMRLSTASEP